jgi:hypothetical protein
MVKVRDEYDFLILKIVYGNNHFELANVCVMKSLMNVTKGFKIFK